METYSIALALEDFLPVIFSAIGLYLLARMIKNMDDRLAVMAYLGAGLIALGGVSKASWKLIYAVSEGQTNIVAIDNALFYFLAPGFILMAFALFYAQRTLAGQPHRKNVWLIPASLAILTVGVAVVVNVAMYDPTREGRQLWFFILLGMTTLFNITALGLAIRQSGQQQERLALILFVVNLLAIFILQGLARVAEQTESLQWIEQIINTIAQIGFVYAVWLLSRSTLELLNKQQNQPVSAYSTSKLTKISSKNYRIK